MAAEVGQESSLIDQKIFVTTPFPSQITGKQVKRTIGGIAIITEEQNSSGVTQSTSTNYLYKDHLGSIDVITDATGAIASSGGEMSFDAWGKRRDAISWQDVNESISAATFGVFSNNGIGPITTRGYTGHEMVDEVGIIHMNGRIYDPKLARFLQADPFVQAPTDTQMLNRYSYVRNNPLNATDPTGHFIFSIAAMIYLAIEGAVWYVAAAIMAGAAFMDALIQGASLSEAFKAGIIAGVSAAAFAGVGEFLSEGFAGSFAAGLSEAGFALKVALHGVVGGITSMLQGGEFGHGFAAAGFTALASSFNNSKFIGGKGFSSTRVVIGAVIGGTASKLSGGKFANGAVTGAFSQALNNEATEQRSLEKQQRLDAKIKEMKAAYEVEKGKACIVAMRNAYREVFGDSTIGAEISNIDYDSLMGELSSAGLASDGEISTFNGSTSKCYVFDH